MDFTSVAGPIQLAVRRVGRGRQRPETRLPVHGLKPGSSPMVEAAAATRQV
ncbi:Hypothetical protein EPM1_0480 [Stenotrophomonas maltophilia EPM1]|nr:Hypothetical protein EPM1_0480 [Stenotrophomonas maltophilia EPM1]